MKEIHHFYIELFNSDPKVGRHVEEHQAILDLITNRIFGEDNLSMMEEPTEKEVEKLVKSLPKDKSPGIDGVMIEMLLKFWDIMKSVCVALVQAFWRDGTMTTRAAT